MGGAWMQSRGQERASRARLIIDAAVKAYDSAEHYAQFMAKQGKTVATPELAYYVILHTKLVERLSAGGSISKEEWIAAHKHAQEVNEAITELHKTGG